MKHLPDIIETLGLIMLAGGVAWQFGLPWALMVTGVVFLVVSFVGRLRASR